MTKKVRKPLEKETAAAEVETPEKLRDRMIKELQEEIRAEKQREEKQAALESERSSQREIQLRRTRHVLSSLRDMFLEQTKTLQEEEAWIRYTSSCDGLPDPNELSEMNRFLFLWEAGAEDASMDTITRKCDIVTLLSGKLKEIVRSKLKSNENTREFEGIARELGEKLARWIDIACYRLLRGIESNMRVEDRKTARYSESSNRIACCLWAPIALPTGTKRIAEKSRQPVEVHFEEMELTVKMPVDLDCYRMAIRALWLEYDRYSEEASATVSMPDVSQDYASSDLDLLEFCRNEYQEIIALREEQIEARRLRQEEKKAMIERIENLPAGAMITDSANTDKLNKRSKKSARKGKQAGKETERQKAQSESDREAELVNRELPYLPTPEEIILEREDEARHNRMEAMIQRYDKHQINLRKCKILGGVYRIDLIHQPAQPKDTRRDILLTALELPKQPRFVEFSRPYEPPPPAPDSERTPEVIEAEMKALEAAMEALILVTLKLPGTVLWFEPPLVAHWIPEENAWTTRDIHDIKYNEEKQTITFRSGRLGIHGLVAYKFVHLPFQSWELKPEMGRNARGGVILSITTGTVQAEFVVRENQICLNSISGGSSSTLKRILGEYGKLESLVEKMRQAGCDLFPEEDAACYVKGLPTKHPVALKHLRECMALLSTAYSFGWSRWNAMRGFREIVLQFKELHGCLAKERTNLTLLVTPGQTMMVRCTEVSSEFSNLPLDTENEERFYGDLYNLALHNAGIKSRLLMDRISFALVFTVAQLLELTNVICASS